MPRRPKGAGTPDAPCIRRPFSVGGSRAAAAAIHDGALLWPFIAEDVRSIGGIFSSGYFEPMAAFAKSHLERGHYRSKDPMCSAARPFS